jgi:hypothetical protein
MPTAPRRTRAGTNIAHSLGTKLEADHETRVAVDVVRRGKCIVYTRRFGQVSWKADDC